MLINLKVVVSIEARLASLRYPKKMTTSICGKNTLEHVIHRLKKSKYINEIVLATSKAIDDDDLCKIAKKEKIKFFRGSEKNVYARVSDAHKKMESEIIVTVCGDCPLIDPFLIDNAIEQYIKEKCDILTFKHNHYFPQGTEFHIFNSKIFHDPVSKINDNAHKEHVGLFFIENQHLYKISFIRDIFEKNYNNIRLQFDYEEDLEFLKKIYSILISSTGDNFDVKDIISLSDLYPGIFEINKNCIEKNVR